MNRTLTVAGVVAILGLIGCHQSSNDMAANPGALPRHTPPSDLKINATTMFAHAHLLERQGSFERAVIQYEKALLEKPDFLTARNRLGITLNKLGRHNEASTEFERCIETHPSLAYLHNNLGFSRYLEGAFEIAEVHLKQAIKLDPEFSRARMNHAVVLSKLGRQQDAYAELEQIGSKADACFNMGILLTEAGQFDSAAQYLEAALASNPKFEAARQQLHEVARLAAEYEARAATEVYAQQPTQPTSPVVASRNQPSRTPVTPAPRESVEIEEVPLSPVATANPTPAPQPAVEPQPVAPTPTEPAVATGNSSTDANIYGDSSPQPRQTFNGSSNTGANTAPQVASANAGGGNVVIEPVTPARTVRPTPVRDPMSVQDTHGRVDSTPAPAPRNDNSMETIYVGSSPVNNSPAPTQSTNVTPEPAPVVENDEAWTSETDTEETFVEDDPDCAEEGGYTVIETIDVTGGHNSTPTPAPSSPQPSKQSSSSSAVIIEPVSGKTGN